MKTTKKALLLFLATGVLVSVASAFRDNSPGQAPQPRGRKVSFYQDSMHPWIKSDRPGKCTICDMDLTPIYEGDQGFAVKAGTVVLNSNNITVLNVQTDEVKRRSLIRSLRVAGTLEANETRKTVVSAPARGRIDALTVDYAGVEVQQGQKLVTLFSPELVQLRKTLLAVREMSQPGMTNSMTKALVDSGIYTGDILAPQSGVVLERNVYSGQYVSEGDRLFTIVDASVLWFRFDVYQDQLPWFRVGQHLAVEVSGIPGRVFPAVITFVEPSFNDVTRTVKVRADIQNPLVEGNGCKQRLLKYGMYAEGRARAEATNVLAVARTAILFPGGSAYAYVDKGNGAYEPRRLKLGRQGDGFWEVLNGVGEGESVVTSGNTLIDSQAQFSLANTPESAAPEETGSPESVAPEHASGGVPPSTIKPSVTEVAVAETDQARPAMEPMGINPVAPMPAREQGAARRTQLMSAIMSPGAELQLRRRASILAELEGQAATSASRPPGNPSPMGLAAAGEARLMAMAETQGQKPAAEPAVATVSESQGQNSRVPLSQIQYQQVQNLLLEADAISGALAADDLAQFKAHAARLPAVLAPVQKELAGLLHWEALMEPLAALSKGDPPKDLEQARTRFLPFSTGMVAFAKRLRQDLPGFPKVMIYHCPMAPKPGLWLQAQAPLRNPFFGSKMLKCGEEVTQ